MTVRNFRLGRDAIQRGTIERLTRELAEALRQRDEAHALLSDALRTVDKLGTLNDELTAHLRTTTKGNP